MEALTSHLQLHAGLHVGLALLDLSLWRDVNGGLIVVPRVPMRTVLIERGIVQVEAGVARIDPSSSSAASMPAKTSPERPKPTTQSEGEFFDHLATKRPELVRPLRDCIADLGELGVSTEIGRSVRLMLSPGPDIIASAGHVETNGKLWLASAWTTANRLGRPDAGEAYLQAVAAIVSGQVRRYEKAAPEVVDVAGHGIELTAVLARYEVWKRSIAELVAALAKTES